MVEHDLAKVGVASSSLVFRSNCYKIYKFAVAKLLSCPGGGMVDALVSGAGVQKTCKFESCSGHENLKSKSNCWRGGGMVDALL